MTAPLELPTMRTASTATVSARADAQANLSACLSERGLLPGTTANFGCTAN